MGHCTFLLSYDEYQYLLLLTTISTVQVPILETVAQLLSANFNINVSMPSGCTSIVPFLAVKVPLMNLLTAPPSICILSGSSEVTAKPQPKRLHQALRTERQRSQPNGSQPDHRASCRLPLAASEN